MKKQHLILDFVRIAKGNGLQSIAAYLPSNHPFIKENKVKQIRKVRDCLAEGFDELGNRVRLTIDCRVIQEY